MNKVILIFGLLFLLISGTVVGISYFEPIEKSTINERIDKQITAENEEDMFIAKTDFNTSNEELQKYVTSQAEIDEMHIRITADKIGGEYISGKVESRNAFRYGTFSFRVNSMNGVGLFPAIWMLPSNFDTAYPEVDIYEMIGNEPDEFYGVLHYQKNEKKERDFFVYDFPKKNIPETYVIRFEWTPDEMTWYLEDKPLHTVRHDVPNLPMYMIFNVAVGGRWPGDPDEHTQFPGVFDIEILEFEPKEIYPR